jgi:hypothetical protein
MGDAFAIDQSFSASRYSKYFVPGLGIAQPNRLLTDALADGNRPKQWESPHLWAY